MTKKEILKLSTSSEMIKNMLKFPKCVDTEVSERQIELAKNEHDKRYPAHKGEYSYHEDPNDVTG